MLSSILVHFGAVVELTRLDFGQAFDLRRVARQVTVHLNARQLVLIAFGDVDGDVDTFLIWRQADLRGIDIEARIPTIQIVAAQGFKVARQLLLLVFTYRLLRSTTALRHAAGR